MTFRTLFTGLAVLSLSACGGSSVYASRGSTASGSATGNVQSPSVTPHNCSGANPAFTPTADANVLGIVCDYARGRIEIKPSGSVSGTAAMRSGVAQGDGWGSLRGTVDKIVPGHADITWGPYLNLPLPAGRTKQAWNVAVRLQLQLKQNAPALSTLGNRPVVLVDVLRGITKNNPSFARIVMDPEDWFFEESANYQRTLYLSQVAGNSVFASGGVLDVLFKGVFEVNQGDPDDYEVRVREFREDGTPVHVLHVSSTLRRIDN